MLYAAGIDVGGTNIKYGLVDEGGQVLFEGLRATDGIMAVENVGAVVTALKQAAMERGIVIGGIGIGVPAIMEDGVVTGCGENLPVMEGLALGALVQEQAGLPVVVENDAGLMGLAELRYGAAAGLTDVVFLTVGTGIGGALVVRGMLYSGYRNRGAELGHIRVASPGRPCGCGASGCLEAHASVKALIREYVEMGGEAHADGLFIFSRFREGDVLGKEVMQRHFGYLGSGIASLINIFSPQKVVIGGGITEAGEDYIAPIRGEALRLAMKETSAHTMIEGALLRNKAGFLGAAARALEAAVSNA